MRISFEPIAQCEDTQPFAQCRGVDLSTTLSTQQVDILRAGLLKHGLLSFPGQIALTLQKEVAFNEAFGWHDREQREFLFGFGAPETEHRVSGGAQLPDCPQVSVLGNVMLEDYHGLRDVQLKPVLGFTFTAWHADGLHDMHSGLPVLTTMYNPVGWKTDSGGETYFTSGVLAIERMAPDVAEELRHCDAVYMRSPNDEFPDESRRVNSGPSCMADDGTRRIGFGVDPYDVSKGLRDFRLTHEHAMGGGRHRCIRRHPLTGQEGLHITPGKVVYLLDASSGQIRHDIDATADILSQALRPSARLGVRYEHRWEEGDFVAWLNPLVLHSASDPSLIEGRRLMHRVRLSTPKT